MKVRAWGAAALVAIGAMLIVAWAVSAVTVRSIEDGTAGNQLVENALGSREVADLVADQVAESLREQVDDPRGQAALVLLDQQVRDAVVAVVSSDVFAGLVSESGDRVRDTFLKEVSDPAREPRAFVLSIDVAERVNSRLADVPVLGAALPAVSLPVVSVEVMSARTFEDLRSIVSTTRFLAVWGVWCGIVALGAGIGLAPRPRAFGARALAIVGVALIVLAFIVGAAGPQALASLMPGGRAGGAGVLVEQVLTGASLAPIAQLLMGVGFSGVVLAALWKIVTRGRGAHRRTLVDDGQCGRQDRDDNEGCAVDLRTTSS